MNNYVVLSEWEVSIAISLTDHDEQPPPTKYRLLGWRVGEPNEHYRVQRELADCDGRQYWDWLDKGYNIVAILCSHLRELGTFPTGE